MAHDSLSDPRDAARSPTDGATEAPLRIDLDHTIVPAAQQALSTARRHAVRLLFDYLGPTPFVYDTFNEHLGETLRLLADYLLAWGICCADEDSVSFRTEVHVLTKRRCLLCMNATNVDPGLHEAVGQVKAFPGHMLERERRLSPLILAANLCRSQHGRFQVRQLGETGWQARAEFELDCTYPAPNTCESLLQPREAWLIGAPPRSLESTARRVGRLGWRVRWFESARDAVEELARPGTEDAPGLALAAGPLGVRRDDVIKLRNTLPASTGVVWLVDVNEQLRNAPRSDIALFAMPMEQSQLAELARQAGRQAPAPLRDGTKPGEKGRALVVDDSEVMQGLTTAMLRRLGFETHIASDGLEAIDRCLTWQPDVVLMDLSMPRMGGLDATRKLRQLQRDGLVPWFPIVALTADSGQIDLKLRRHLGLDDVLPKPISLGRLGIRMHRVLADNASAQRRARRRPPSNG
jgi:CheY-like chemotaxis protein